MMCCCLLDSKASVMVLPRHLVTWLGPHEAGPCCQSRSRWWTWGTHGHRPTTSLVNAKQKLLRSQSFFQHTSPRPTNFNVVWPKLLYNEPLHLQDLAFNVEIGGGGPPVVQRSWSQKGQGPSPWELVTPLQSSRDGSQVFVEMA